MNLTNRMLIVYAAALFIMGATVAVAQKPPDKLTFASKMGNVTFDHAAHVTRAKGDCKTCHDKLFPMSSTAPLNFKAAMHKTAEAAHTSCGGCHNPTGPGFETKGNCAKCHVK